MIPRNTPVGTRVVHDYAEGRGPGVIVGLNSQEPMPYLEERPLEALSLATEAGLTEACLNAFYSADRYPFRVRFDRDGYTDVYGCRELRLES